MLSRSPRVPSDDESSCCSNKKSSAYTIYAFFEWSLILFDIGFDAVTVLDFKTFEIVVRDIKGLSKGYVEWLPR